MFRMTSLSSAFESFPEIFFPLYCISPAAQGFTRITARPIVVFPEPDSPTSENVSPLKISKLAFLTARTALSPLPNVISTFFSERSISLPLSSIGPCSGNILERCFFSFAIVSLFVTVSFVFFATTTALLKY